MTVAGVLLAAGSSRRFGKEDKLLSPLHNRPLVTYAAEALRAVKPEHLIAVVRSPAVANLLTAYETVPPTEPDPLQSDSLRAGVALARARGATRILITLGDMPFVTPQLLNEVVSKGTESAPAAATDGKRRLPPACFPESHFPDLLALEGDRGAGALLRSLPGASLISVHSTLLSDIDTPVALEAANVLEFPWV